MTLKKFRDSVFSSGEMGYHYSISHGKVYAHRLYSKHEYVCVSKDCDDVIYFRDGKALNKFSNINEVDGYDWAYFSNVRSYMCGYISSSYDEGKIQDILKCMDFDVENEIEFGMRYTAPTHLYEDLNIKNLIVPQIYVATVQEQARFNMIRNGYGIEKLLYKKGADKYKSRYVAVCLDASVPISARKSYDLCERAIKYFCDENLLTFDEIPVTGAIYL